MLSSPEIVCVASGWRDVQKQHECQRDFAQPGPCQSMHREGRQIDRAHDQSRVRLCLGGLPPYNLCMTETISSALSTTMILTLRPACWHCPTGGSRQPIKQLVHGAIDGVEPARVRKHRLRRLYVAALDNFVCTMSNHLLGTGLSRLQMKLDPGDSFVVDEGLVRAAGAARDVDRARWDIEGIPVPVESLDSPGECGKQAILGRGLRRFDRKPANLLSILAYTFAPSTSARSCAPRQTPSTRRPVAMACSMKRFSSVSHG